MKCTSCHAPCMESDPCCPHCGGGIARGGDNPNIMIFCVAVFVALGAGLSIALSKSPGKFDGEQIMIAGVVGAIAGAVGYVVGRIATYIARRS